MCGYSALLWFKPANNPFSLLFRKWVPPGYYFLFWGRTCCWLSRKCVVVVPCISNMLTTHILGSPESECVWFLNMLQAHWWLLFLALQLVSGGHILLHFQPPDDFVDSLECKWPPADNISPSLWTHSWLTRKYVCVLHSNLFKCPTFWFFSLYVILVHSWSKHLIFFLSQARLGHCPQSKRCYLHTTDICPYGLWYITSSSPFPPVFIVTNLFWVFQFIILSVYLTFVQAVILILKHATFIQLSTPSTSAALTQSELDYQQANIGFNIQEHLRGSSPEHSIKELVMFIMATDIGSSILASVPKVSHWSFSAISAFTWIG